MIPTLKSGNVILTPFTLVDAPLVEIYAGSFEVACTTLNIPHPYPKGIAEKWIASHWQNFQDNRDVVFAIRSSSKGELVGAINLHLDLPNKNAELGYWIGFPHWGKGYGTDAARELVRFGFENYGLNKMYGRHFHTNPASGRVMEKAGMTREGLLRQHLIKNDEAIDVVEYGILRIEFENNNQPA